MKTDRRKFLAKASVMAAAAAGAVIDAPAVIAQPRVQWKMSTAYGASLDMLHGVAVRLARTVEETSGGRFKIEVFPAGQIMAPFACFDAASQGQIEALMGVSAFWSSKEPAMEWFMSVPFGMNPLGMQAWYYQGDGLKLFEETWAPFNLVPRIGPAMAPQMAGWFRKKINTMADYKGFKIRIAGLGGKVYTKAGGTAVLTPGSEVYAELERGVIDACEWMAPFEDMKMNLHNTARYYYYPGWHEPGTMMCFGFNKKAYDALPVDLQRTLDYAAAVTQVYGLTDYHARNAIALEKLKTEFKGKVDIIQLPVPVLKELRKLSADVVRDESEKSPMATKVNASFTKFQRQVAPWDHLSEGAYHQLVSM